MKTIKKSTSLILAALLLLGIFTILPLTSSAATAEIQNLSRIDITGLTPPRAGEIINQTADSGTGYTIESVGWWNKTDGFFLLEGDKFSSDKTYTARIKVKTTDGYSFDNPSVTVNGADASAIPVDGFKPEECLLITADFSTSEKSTETTEATETTTDTTPTQEPSEISFDNSLTAVDITGLTPPKAGEIINQTADSGTGYTIESVGWWNKTDGFFLLEGDKFSSDKTYTARIKVRATRGYSFDNPSVTVNGADASAIPVDGFKPEECLLITADFSTSEKSTEEITQPTTEEPTEEVTQTTTEEVTQPGTEETTEKATQPSTEEPSTASVTKNPTNPVVNPGQSKTPSPAKKVTAPAKKPNPLKVSVKSPTVKLKKLKKSAQKVKALNIKNAKGKISCKIKNAKKNIKPFLKISSKGVITIKKWKAAVKGTYNITVKITANGTKTYSPETIKKTVKIKIK
ncbi:MAG: hypothetical protein VZR54_06765 [Ruminococcus sp.]|nr:hypothetical protein [Ruminococcus sp.]